MTIEFVLLAFYIVLAIKSFWVRDNWRALYWIGATVLTTSVIFGMSGVAMGKGDTRRPSSVSKEEYDKNYESVFGPPRIRTVMSDEERAEFEAEKDRLSEETSNG